MGIYCTQCIVNHATSEVQHNCKSMSQHEVKISAREILHTPVRVNKHGTGQTSTVGLATGITKTTKYSSLSHPILSQNMYVYVFTRY